MSLASVHLKMIHPIKQYHPIPFGVYISVLHMRFFKHFEKNCNNFKRLSVLCRRCAIQIKILTYYTKQILQKPEQNILHSCVAHKASKEQCYLGMPTTYNIPVILHVIIINRICLTVDYYHNRHIVKHLLMRIL